MNNHTGTQAKLKKRIVCKNCSNVFKNKSKIVRTQCPNCGKIIDARIRKGYYKEWTTKHPEKAKIRLDKLKEYNKKYGKEHGKRTRERIRLGVLNVVGKNNLVCENCGCNDVKLLEVNHKNGGGNKELQGGKRSNNFAWDIYMLRRKTDDLNLLCRVCNSLHYLELKHGKLPFKIIYDKD